MLTRYKAKSEYLATLNYDGLLIKIIGMKKLLLNVLVSAVVAYGVIYINGGVNSDHDLAESKSENKSIYKPVINRSYTQIDFTEVASEAVKGTVHIKSIKSASSRSKSDLFRSLPPDIQEYYRQYFGLREQSRPDREYMLGAGTGVIISPNGYIVTNNHVVDGADRVEVNLYDGTVYEGKIVGVDPSTDLAVVKVEAEDLTALGFVNSDEVKVGEWVLAIGNPFDLNSTVTAGIVSAKSRSLNLSRNQYAIESFIQTDAAINPGNSGGALVDVDGGLIGINTAIASPTGAYAGYGFAVPSNIANKVVLDLIEFGQVKRAIMGVSIAELNKDLVDRFNLSISRGILIPTVQPESAAALAGMEEGDVITALDSRAVVSIANIQEYMAQKSPGDLVAVTVDRGGDTIELELTLKELR